VPHAVLVSFGYLGTLLVLASTLFQLRRVQVEGVEGVSLATWMLFSLTGCFWIAYGAISAHSIVIILGSLLVLPMQLSILFRLKPWLHLRTVAGSLGFVLCLTWSPGLVWGWPGTVYGTGVAMTFMRAPQILELIRERDAGGVSTTSWFYGTGCSFSWVIYYIGQHLWAALASTAAAGVASLAVALLSLWRHHQARMDQRAEVLALG